LITNLIIIIFGIAFIICYKVYRIIEKEENRPIDYTFLDEPLIIEEPKQPLNKIARIEYPQKLNEYIGHIKVVKQLEILVSNYHKLDRVPKHILLYGQGGLGKTCLAEIFANEIGQGIISILGEDLSSLERIKELLNRLERGSMLFADEVHNVPTNMLEYLYSVLEYFKLPDGIEVHTYPKFTFVGATTRLQDLPDPFLQRMTYKFRLERYNKEDISSILPYCLDTDIKSITIEAQNIIARIAQGTIRIARNEYLSACTELSLYSNKNIIDNTIIEQLIHMKEIDLITGFTPVQIKTITALREGLPIGVKNLAFKIGIDSKDLEENVEPTLIYEGYIERTGRGRVITNKGREFLEKRDREI